jgi:hypothetical protein
VVDDDTYSAVLAELDGIANAAMTQSEREVRASPVLQYSSVAVSDVCAAMAGADLGWNRRKASAYGVSPAHWQQALAVAGLPGCDSLGGLLQVIHRAESGAAMLRAGYKPSHDEAGCLHWSP